MTIANVVSGFCGTGIYPFSPHVILSKFPDVPTDDVSSKDKSLPSSAQSDTVADQSDTVADQSDTDKSSFSSEIIELYKRRLQNGYNLCTYVAWLEKFHPEHLPSLGMYICHISECDHPIIL